jgi:hypothetical protein
MGGGGLISPILDIGMTQARVGLTIGIPAISFGVFCLQNITFSAAITLSFIGDPLNIRLAFCERSNPFLLTVSMFGGGGFFAIEFESGRIKLIEAALEFGGSFSLNLGVASGGVTVMAGIYFKYVASEVGEGGDVVISGYVRCVGSLDVLGIITISARFDLSLTYQKKSDGSEVVSGRASLEVKIEVLFFSIGVTLTVEREFGHSSAPLFADIMDEAHWLDYCEAFA